MKYLMLLLVGVLLLGCGEIDLKQKVEVRYEIRTVDGYLYKAEKIRWMGGKAFVSPHSIRFRPIKDGRLVKHTITIPLKSITGIIRND